MPWRGGDRMPLFRVDRWLTGRHMPRHVIVDGSNLATEGRSMPSLQQLNDAVTAFMAENPTDLITVVVDATFGHRIDPKEVPEFEAALASLEVGAVSAVVRTQFGFHLIRLDAMEQKPFDDLETVRDRARMAVRGEKIEAEEKLYVAELRKKVFVEVRELGRVD